MYKCEAEGCEWKGMIRSRISDRDHEWYGLKVCPAHREQTVSKKEVKGIARSRKPVKRSNKVKESYKDFFTEFAAGLPNRVVSQESGSPITEVTSANFAHLLPKADFKDVSRMKENIFILALNEHSRFDNLLFSRKFTTLVSEFPKAWEQLKKVLPITKVNNKLTRDLWDFINKSK